MVGDNGEWGEQFMTASAKAAQNLRRASLVGSSGAYIPVEDADREQSRVEKKRVSVPEASRLEIGKF